jgi:hypothetical protein
MRGHFRRAHILIVLEDLIGSGMFLSNVFDVHKIIFAGGVGVVMYINGA